MQSGSICVSIGDENYTDIINVLQNVNFAEIRLDLNNIDDSEIESLFSGGKKLIATCREGRYTKNERIARLSKAIRSGAEYVDVETESDDFYLKTIIETAHKSDCKVIVSYHNFEATPSLEEMLSIIADCKKQGADIVKLVTTAVSKSDAARVMSLYDHYNGGGLVAFAMGKKGLITRVACVLLGAPFTYAAFSEDKQVASGQLPADIMTKIINYLK